MSRERIEQLEKRLRDPLRHPPAAALGQYTRRVADWGLQHFLTLADQPVGQTASRQTLEQALRRPAPERPVPCERLFSEFQEYVCKNTYRVQHPRFFAFVPGAPSYFSVLGDWLSSSLNCYPSVWYEGAGAAQVELIVLDWFKEWLGFPAEAAGTLTSGGSEANLTALVVAREQVDFADRRRIVMYMPDQRHWSVDKAAKVIGLHPDQLRLVPTDDGYRLSVEALEKQIAQDRSDGKLPWLVLANAGSTNTGAVDPLAALADLCRREKLWLHVDAAYGWAAVLDAEARRQLEGIERADSVTLDPHKWLAQTFEAGCLLVRDGRLLPQTFAMRPEYLQDVTPAEGEVNFADYSITLTRRFRALKIWLSVQALGLAWYRDLVRRCLDLAELLELRLRQTGKFEVAARSLSVVCFRYLPGGDEATTEQANRSIVDHIRRSERVFFTSTRLRGRTVLRCCFVNWRTTAADVEAVVDEIRQATSQ